MKLQISSSALGVVLETFWRKRALGNGTACASEEHFHFWLQNDMTVKGSNVLEGSHPISYAGKSWNIEIIDNGCVKAYGLFDTLNDTHGSFRNGNGDDGPGCFVPQITVKLTSKELKRQN